MNSIFIIISIIFVACLAAFLMLYLAKSMKIKSKTQHNFMVARESRDSGDVVSIKTYTEDRIGTDFSLVDESSSVLLLSREIQSIPKNAQKIDMSGGGSARQQVTHLVSDIFKATTGTPNKTIELVFKKGIQEGLQDGSYTLMRTKSGEVLADAVDSSGTIVGKGRVIQGGKVRQLASGAFQLVSIVVAQSHLADIEASLGHIKSSLAEILDRMETGDRADILGAIAYLKLVAQQMRGSRSPEELPVGKEAALEGLIQKSRVWQEKLRGDFDDLIRRIANQKDLDTVGTGDTFLELKSNINKSQVLISRHDLLMQLTTALSVVTAYMDPVERKFTRIESDTVNWHELADRLRSTVSDAADKHLSGAWFNQKEVLQLRNSEIKHLGINQSISLLDQQKMHEKKLMVLRSNLDNMLSDGDLHMAISFDKDGVVNEAAII